MVVKLFHEMSFLSKKLILTFLLKHIKKQIPWLYFPLHTHIWLTYILLPTTFYSSTHFAPRNTLPFNTVCSPEHSAPWNTLLPRTLCFLAHFAFWNTLLLGTLRSLEHIAPSWLFLLKILCTMDHLKWSVPGSKVFHGVKCSREQSVLRCKVC